MKNKILVIALAFNIIAGSFILYGFMPKEKKVNEAGSQYITVMADWSHGSISATDGTNTFDNTEIHGAYRNSKKDYEENNLNITNELKNISMKGYELISSTSLSLGNISGQVFYVFKKK
jgi:hypothetical protein